MAFQCKLHLFLNKTQTEFEPETRHCILGLHTVNVSSLPAQVRRELIKCTDARVRLVTEVITGIKVRLHLGRTSPTPLGALGIACQPTSWRAATFQAPTELHALRRQPRAVTRTCCTKGALDGHFPSEVCCHTSKHCRPYSFSSGVEVLQPAVQMPCLSSTAGPQLWPALCAADLCACRLSARQRLVLIFWRLWTRTTLRMCSSCGLQAIKLYAWEEPYIRRVSELRHAELVMIRKAALIQVRQPKADPFLLQQSGCSCSSGGL